MRILILGAGGMLGHALLRQLERRHEVAATLRLERAAYAGQRLFDGRKAYHGVDVRHTESLVEVLADFRPDVVVNAIGIVKQRPQAGAPSHSIEINALFPHRLVALCRAVGARLVHFGTDCVFSGRTGGYRDADVSDAEDLYGRTKYLGEVSDPAAITLRTSMIGAELGHKTGLLEWFLAQRATVKGYTQAIFSGLTTLELARVVDKIVVEFPAATGIYNVAADPISKYRLLCLIRDAMKLAVEIVPDGSYRCDRSLDASRFRAQFRYQPPSWEAMVTELVSDLTGRATRS